MDNKNLPVERQMLAIFKYWDVLHKKYERAKSKQAHNAKLYANCLMNCKRLERHLTSAMPSRTLSVWIMAVRLPPTLWVGLHLASTRLVWVLVIL